MRLISADGFFFETLNVLKKTCKKPFFEKETKKSDRQKLLDLLTLARTLWGEKAGNMNDEKYVSRRARRVLKSHCATT